MKRIEKELDYMMSFLVTSAKSAARCKEQALSCIEDIRAIKHRWGLLIKDDSARELQMRLQYLEYVKSFRESYLYHMKNVDWAKGNIYKKIKINQGEF